MAKKGVNNRILMEEIERGLRITHDGAIVKGSGKTVKPFLKNGYMTIALGPRRRHFTVGRVVCWLHYGPPPSQSHMVDHINRDRLDDRPENLRWATPSENTSNVSAKAATWRKKLATRLTSDMKLRGLNHPYAKSMDMIRQIREMLESGMSQADIARRLGCSQSMVSKIYRGVHWSSNTP